MAYLVTGGTGFVGSFVTRDLLKAGKEVVCLQRSGVTPLFREVVGEENLSQVKIIQMDVSDTLRFLNVVRDNKIEVIIHLASLIASSGASEALPSYTIQVNCLGTSNALEAGRLLGVRRIIWTSSGQALGRVGESYNKPIGDDTALYAPDMMYGASKVLNEYMSRHYFDKFGVDNICLRLGYNLGIGRTLGRAGIFTNFLKNVATNVPSVWAAPDVDRIRAISYIENTSDLIVKACEAPKTKTRTFNAMEFMVSTRQMVAAMRKVNPEVDLKLKDKVKPEEATLGGTAESKLDNSGVMTELGWKPKYSLEEALKKIFNYFRQKEGLPLL